MSFFDKICKRENGPKLTERIALAVFVLFVFGFVLFLCFQASKFSRSSPSVQNRNVNPIKLPLPKSNYTPPVVKEKVQKQEYKTKKQENVSWSYSNDCQTEFCQDYSKVLSKHIDISVDPCSDFHQYVCGSWNSNSRTALSQMQVDIYETVLVALSKTKRTKSKAVNYVLDLYNEFVDEKTRAKVDFQSMRQLLQKVLGSGQWPRPASVPSPSPRDQVKISDQFEQFWDSKSAFYIKFELDRTDYDEFKQFWKSWMSWKLLSNYTNGKLDNNANVNQWMDWYVETVMIHNQPLMSIINWDIKSHKIKANEISLLNAEVTEDIMELFGNFRALKEMAMLLKQIDEPLLVDWGSSLNNALFEVLDFYIKLSSIFPKSIPGSESKAKMKTITLGELKENYSSPGFDWTLLLNKFATRTGASLRYTDNDTVRVPINQLALFGPFTEVLVRTPIRVLKNEMGWELIQISAGLSLLHVRPEIAITDFVIKYFYQFEPIFVRLSIDLIGRQKMLSARGQAIKLVRHMKENFRDSMKHDRDWLDEETRQNALDKLEALKMMIAFPDWILDDAVLDENYGFFSQPYLYTKDSTRFIKGDYITSFLNFRRLSMGAEFRKNDQSLQVDREFQFFNDKPAYYLHPNLIGVSHALLTDPWFNVDYPPSVNYGKFGFIIAHEMMHAFDQEGRLYDKHGEKVNWWADSTSEHFEMLSKCFVQQYDGLTEPITGLKINGTATLRDNIADSGGLNQAFLAFEKIGLKYWQNTTFEAYPSFRVQFTPEQLFFVSYGIIWCSNGLSFDEFSKLVKSDSHSPNRFRVNIPLSNMDQFAKAFNCPVGSPMNPEHKCSIW